MGRTAGRHPEHVQAITVAAVHQRILVPEVPHPEGVQAVGPPGRVGTNELTKRKAVSRVGGHTPARLFFFATFFANESI